MNRILLGRRLALTSMAVVTAWSLWAWSPASAQPSRPDAPSASHAMPGAGRPPPALSAQALTAPARGESEGKPEAEDNEPPAPINWFASGRTPPFIATLINFGILVAGYYLLGKRPVAAALQNRRAAITKDIDEAQSMKREAEARAKMYAAKFDRLAEDMKSARDSLVHAGEAEHERLIQEAEMKAERMRKDTQFLVEQEVKQIRQDLMRDAVDAAVSAAESLLKERVTAADQERLAEDFLAGLPAHASVPGAGAEEKS